MVSVRCEEGGDGMRWVFDQSRDYSLDKEGGWMDGVVDELGRRAEEMERLQIVGRRQRGVFVGGPSYWRISDFRNF
ncbi:unnamed protein product [Linum tenue]|uniref:Uncharacterized protein n=1 Tax=Linum tenue TaxID=586396 RepID=A0AAV0LLT0_9ROSI|nr:unnamed protein product [Linum tenue]